MIHPLARRIFVAHPSSLLTDHRSHGDGLVAHGFLRELGARGHDLHVAVEAVDLRAPLPSGVHLHVLGRPALPAPAARLGFMWRMRRLWRELGGVDGFDLVHQLNPVDVGLSLALADAPVPVVLGPYVPDWPPSGPGAEAPAGRATAALKRALRAAQQRRATTVLLSTPAAAAKLAVPPGRHPQVRDVGPGIDAEAWAPGPAPGPDRQDVLVLANLNPRKGVLVALDAFARVAAARPGARLLVAGTGPQEAEVRRRVAADPALARVRLLGHLDRDAARAAVRDCAVLCVPSFGEPFGMTVLEAMACARPVVATDAGGPAHLVTDGGGRRVPPGDPAALAGALEEVLGDPGRQAAMGAHNRRLVEERHAWPRVVDRLEAAYADAVADPRPALRPGRGAGARPRAAAG